jgi:hypothetical protein
LLHIDASKLGRIDGIGHRITGDRTWNHNRGIGWATVRLAIDAHLRAAFAQPLPDEKAVSCVQFLRRGEADHAKLGVRIGKPPCNPSPIDATGIGRAAHASASHPRAAFRR